MKQKLVKFLATWFGAGLIPKAPGTVGTLAALPFAWVIEWYGGNAALFAASAVAFATGCWISGVYVQETGRKDPQEVVIDEVAAMWLVLAFFQQTVAIYIVAFLCFRVCDILKPWPASWADKNVKGGLGVMLDDLLAVPHAVLMVWLYLHYVQPVINSQGL